MFLRSFSLPKGNVLILGARGVGKSTLLKGFADKTSKAKLIFDLEDAETEDSCLTNPHYFESTIHENLPKTVLIDGLQKVPNLFKNVIQLSFQNRINFIISSSQKMESLDRLSRPIKSSFSSIIVMPLSSDEFGLKLKLDQVLQFGSLPKIYFEKMNYFKIKAYLQKYITDYLNEEVFQKRRIKNSVSFRVFLKIAAQNNGSIIDYEKISRQVSVDPKTIQSFYKILDETFLGFSLKSYSRLIRKRQGSKSKFYFFDSGVKRAIDKTLSLSLQPRTEAYQQAFEHWIILEAYRKVNNLMLDVQLSFLRTSGGLSKIDLIAESHGNYCSLIEINSSEKVDDQFCEKMLLFALDFPNADFYIASKEKNIRQYKNILIGPWDEILKLAIR